MNVLRSKGLASLLMLAALGAGCASATSGERATSPAQSAGIQLVNHVTPQRDFVGPAPTSFSWTAVAGADSYSLGIWNEVDVMIWRQNGIPSTSVAVGPELRLEPGTYMWAVSALREGQLISESGLSAFVVRSTP